MDHGQAEEASGGCLVGEGRREAAVAALVALLWLLLRSTVTSGAIENLVCTSVVEAVQLAVDVVLETHDERVPGDRVFL